MNYSKAGQKIFNNTVLGGSLGVLGVLGGLYAAGASVAATTGGMVGAILAGINSLSGIIGTFMIGTSTLAPLVGAALLGCGIGLAVGLCGYLGFKMAKKSLDKKNTIFEPKFSEKNTTQDKVIDKSMLKPIEEKTNWPLKEETKNNNKEEVSKKKENTTKVAMPHDIDSNVNKHNEQNI